MPQGPDGQRRAPDLRSAWSAADDGYATIGDYARFVSVVMRNDGLSPDIARQHLDVAVVQFRDRCPWSKCPRSGGFALGWAVFDYGRERVVLQGGADWGERTIALFVPERDLGLVVLTNGASGSQIILEVTKVVYGNADFHRFLAFQARGR